jgi:hypothetical protein
MIQAISDTNTVIRSMSSAPVVQDQAPFSRKLPITLLFSAAFALPLVRGAWFRADPLAIANESLAYRSQFSESQFNGDGSSVWVLAGFLTTAIRTSPLKLINLCSGFPLGDLPDGSRWFSYLSIGGVVVSAIIAFLAASCHLCIDDAAALISRAIQMRSEGTLNLAARPMVSFLHVANLVIKNCDNGVRLEFTAHETGLRAYLSISGGENASIEAKP